MLRAGVQRSLGKPRMRQLVLILLRIAKMSMAHPGLVILVSLVFSIAGFSTLPLLTISTDVISGVGETDPVIRLTKENNELFGEQDALIIVLEFPEPPGEARLSFIKGLAEAIENLPGVSRIRYRFFDPEDKKQTVALFKQFLLGMNEREREQIRSMANPEMFSGAIRRNTNRLYLSYDPYLQKLILEDPLELGQFVAQSMTKRIGSINLGDPYLLISSPDSTIYIIHITPQFPSYDLLQGQALVTKLNETIPATISSLMKTIPDGENQFKAVTWRLTGKVMFQQESAEIFDRETLTIILCSFVLVLALLLAVYRNFWSTVLLLTPLAAGIGPNYGIMYLTYPEINPVVMGATGVLLGMGTEYGEHLWGRIREELDGGTSHTEAVLIAYEKTGPPVMLGALTGILAFLCLTLSNQPALTQFGYLGASGLVLTFISTLFMVPALAKLASTRKRDVFPRIRVSFKTLSTLFQHRPGLIVAVSFVVILVSIFFASRVSYEKDLLKVFLAQNMESMAWSKKISEKFHSDFSRPTYLSFDVSDLNEGLAIQRRLDGILENLREKYGNIASFDSISYLMSPDSVQQANIEVLSHIAKSWPQLEVSFKQDLAHSKLSERSQETMNKYFGVIGETFKTVREPVSDRGKHDFTDLERSWYMANVGGKYRFLTHVRYSSSITDPSELKRADARILEAAKRLPVPVWMSGTRQAMEAILSGLVAELIRLGLYAFVAVVVIFFIILPRPRWVGFCLVPMIGAFAITLGVFGATGTGLPFSIVCVGPLIFGFGIHNSIHIVMGSLFEAQGSVAKATTRVTPRAMVVSLTIIMGFVSMLTSQHYALRFLGCAMIIGMLASVPLTLTTLPAMLLLMGKWKNRQ
jgi:uncharacterized protein